MSEITPLVNSYCKSFKQKEHLRCQTSEISKELKETHEKLKNEMAKADLRIIRSLSAGYDIKLYQKVKKQGQSVKNLRTSMEKHNISSDTIDSVMNDIKTGKEETSQIIKLIPLNKTKSQDVPIVSS
jgi:hypothetical protein